MGRVIGPCRDGRSHSIIVYFISDWGIWLCWECGWEYFPGWFMNGEKHAVPVGEWFKDSFPSQFSHLIDRSGKGILIDMRWSWYLVVK